MGGGRHQDRGLAAAEYSSSQEVSSVEWGLVSMTEQEEDLIYRMYRLVGDRWGLIAGRIPGRKPEEIERFLLMRQGMGFAEGMKKHEDKRKKYFGRRQSS